ncbi:uncharacterized protein LOC105278065 isoform X2 [Ooceraea biroi]|uniref:uncharacterized protein LOC105278065 isoform X2 n=1 Tax=Ooceraea biroi TaxID=2015173 RepID=UPI000F07C8F9|nr:uncharacterized protein LOC105278065 isoform X2 [Ooceraea biroi]
MGEGKSDRPGKRQRSTSRGKPPLDSEIAHGKGKGKGRRSKVKERWPFIEGLTVDELARYRRRRVQDQPKDNLQPHPESAVRDPASEYRRAFGVTSIEELSKENVRPIKDRKPEDYLLVEGIVEDAQSPYLTDLAQGEAIEDQSAKEDVPSQLVDGNEAMETKTDVPQFETSFGRPPLIRRGTSLKCDGDFYTDTETYSAYVPYEGQHRAELARRPTSLKMEGDLDTMTEKCEKFIEWLNVSRPELMRVPTHLKMEGELETATENQDKYVPFVGARRPELLRRGTNLKLEGDIYFVPEYTEVFKDYSVKDKLQSMRPQTHLKAGGEFFQDTESTEHFAHPRVKQMQETAEEFKDDEDNEEEKRWKREEEEKQKKDEEMKMLVLKLEDLNGRPLEIPEYRDAYKNFSRERPKIVKPDDEIGRADGSKVTSPSRSKFSMKIDQDPEYQSKYLREDYPRDRPIYRKPPLMLRPTGISSSGRSSTCFARPTHQECRAFEYEPTSEVRSQYVPYGYVPRVETLKMPANLRLEGNYELQPEYRNAYCARYDRQSCDKPRTMYGRSDRSPSASRRRDKYWLSDTNVGQCDRMAVAQDLDAFRVLDTRFHDDNVTGKPPPASRRSSRHSQITVAPRPTQLELADRAVMRTRSPSPTYRLHVCDVDNEPRGFGRQSSGRIRSPSADRTIHDNVARPYSPSFGRTKQDCRRGDSQPFVVLADASKDASCRSEMRRRRTDRNVDVTVPISRGRPRTPTRWMPPWYDNTNTI